MTTKCWDQMPGFCPWRSKSHGSVAWCPCTWLQEEVCWPQDAQGFSARWAKVILHMWTCWRHVSLKAVVFDWWSHVPLIIHALCLYSSGCQIPLARLTTCRLLQQVSMTFLFEQSHLLWLLCITELQGLQPFYCLLDSLSCSISSPVYGPTHSTMWTHFWVSCQILKPPAK